MTAHDLLQRIDAAKGKGRTMLAQYPNGNMSDEVRSQWEGIETEITQLTDQLRRQSFLDDQDRRTSGTPLTGGSDDHLDHEIAKVNLLDVIRAGMGETDHAAGHAREISRELERRSGRKADGLFWSMRTPDIEKRVTTSSAAASIIPTEYHQDMFIDLLRAAAQVRSLGARMLTGLSGNVSIPTRTGSMTAGWVAENAALTLSDQAFDAVTMAPHHAGVITEYSRNMLLQTSPDIEALTRADMVALLGQALDRAAIKGLGGGTAEPEGILTKAVPTVGYDSPAVYYDTIATMIGTVAAANAEQGALGFYCSPVSIRTTLSKLKDGQQRPYGLDVLFQGFPYRFGNVPTGDSPDLRFILYGNWSDLLIGTWSELDILVNPYETTAYKKGNVQVRAMMTMDVAVRHIESFVALLNAA
jgi:HK97 family phage major capsid protein